MWTGNSDNLAPQSPKNYMFGQKVFILDEICTETCAYLIGDLTNFIMNEDNQFSEKNLHFYINSRGGDVNVMLNIIGLMNLARLYNITIQTFVFGQASSAASVLAAQGDYRVMSKYSKHFIHFGSMWSLTTKQSEIEKIYKQSITYAKDMDTLYLLSSKGKLTQEILNKLQEDERGYLSAEECLKYGLCDCIIEEALLEKEETESERKLFEKEFEKMKRESRKNSKKRN